LPNSSFDRSWRVPAAYRLLRALVRFGAWLWFPKVRLLNREKLQQSQAALLIVNYPASFRAALLLAATLDRPVLFLLPSQNFRGPFQKLMGRGLGIIPAGFTAEDPSLEMSFFTGALANWGAIALFAGGSGRKRGQRTPDADLAAKISAEAAKQQIELAICALHGFLTFDNRKTTPVVYVQGPIHAQSARPETSENSLEPAERLADAVQKNLEENVFALEPVEIDRFRRDLEDISHEDVEEEWSQLPNWKQQAGDLHLSGLVKQWVDKQNQSDPGRLVALRNLVDDYREARRRCWMGRFVVETAGPWQKSVFQIALAWIECLLGLPIALYGLVNHAAPGAILFLAGLLKKSGKRDPKVEWLLRAFVVLGCYSVQVLLFDLWQGRAAAGYYALTLPLSGAYLWRYLWLARHRGHLLLLRATLPLRSVRLLRARKNLLGKLKREIARYAESLGMPS